MRDGGLVAIRGLQRAATDRLCEEFKAWTAIALGDASVVIGATQAAIERRRRRRARAGRRDPLSQGWRPGAHADAAGRRRTLP